MNIHCFSLLSMSKHKLFCFNVLIANWWLVLWLTIIYIVYKFILFKNVLKNCSQQYIWSIFCLINFDILFNFNWKCTFQSFFIIFKNNDFWSIIAFLCSLKKLFWFVPSFAQLVILSDIVNIFWRWMMPNFNQEVFYYFHDCSHFSFHIKSCLKPKK